MAGSTRLFQRAGSPLIQGHSRHARSFAVDRTEALISAVVGVYAALAAATLAGTSPAKLASVTDVAEWLLQGVGGLVVAAAGCALGVLVARGMGWRRAWLAGALLGAAAGVIVTLWTRQLF